MTNASRATVSVPAAGPNRRTDVKTNVSEIDIVAGTDGNFTVAEPLIKVRIARINQLRPIGTAYIAYIDCAIAHTPRAATVPT